MAARKLEDTETGNVAGSGNELQRAELSSPLAEHQSGSWPTFREC